MFKHKIFVFIVLIAVFISGEAYAQPEDQQIKMIKGTVTYVDPESGIIKAITDEGDMVFILTTESLVYRYTQPMSSIEIALNDPVTIQYTSASGKYVIKSLVDSQPSKI